MKNEDMNFDLNLLPVISLLAVIISFLLLTAVWIQVGTLDVRQAVGESSEMDSKTPTVVLVVTAKEAVTLSIKNKKTGFKKLHFKKSDSQWEELGATLEQIKIKHPEITTAMVTPAMKSKYQTVIRALETLKNQNIKDIGVSPVM